ncbi:MAG TPA: DUF167 family protein [Methylomirabilota bacterium]|nr:DUF167 family protein [Methylomirabilota bacterium]
MAGEGVWRVGGDLLLDVRLTPRADRDRIDGPSTLSDDATVLAVRVRAVPEDGKANAALTMLLAKALGLPKSRVTLETGATQRRKTLRIADADDAVEAAVRALLAR